MPPVRRKLAVYTAFPAMRIALISSQFPPESIGGIGTYSQSVAGALSRRGHDVEIFTATQGPARTSRETGSLVHRIICGEPSQFSRLVVPAFAARHRQAVFDVLEGPELFSQTAGIRAACPDLPLIVRIHSPMSVAQEFDERAFTRRGRWLQFVRFFLGSLARFKSLEPAWRFGRNEVWRRPKVDRLNDPERRSALNADLVTVPSTPMYERMVRDWLLPVGRLRLLPNLCPPDAALFAIDRKPEGTEVLFFGRLIAFKGALNLASALPRVFRRNSSARMTFAGQSGISPVTDLSLRAFIQGRILDYRDSEPFLRNQLGRYGARVRFTGAYERSDLPQILSGADICVLPSWWDNFPSACLEAMAAGRAIIATRSGGMVDMLDDGRCGILVEPQNPPALAEALLTLLADPELRLELGRQARQRVGAAYAESSLALQYEEAFALTRTLHADKAGLLGARTS